MAVAILGVEQSGLAAAMHVREQLLAAWDKDENLVLDLGEIASADLALIQTIEAARVKALAEGRTFALMHPANTAIAAVLEQSGLLWAADPADLAFWFHQGEDA